MKKLYLEDNLTTYEIAQMLGCCQGTIWNRLHSFCIKPRRPCTRLANVPSKSKLIKLYKKKKMSTWEIEKKFGFGRGTVHRKLKEFGIDTRNLSDSHIIYPRKSFSGNLIEKAHMIGFTLGDLRVRKSNKCGSTIQIECGTTKSEQLKLIEDMFKNYGHVWISKPNKRGAISVGANLDMSFEFLIVKTAPDWVFDDKKHFFSFLAGFTDAEGSIGVNNGQAIYQLGNYDSELLRSIHKSLAIFGIESRAPYNDHTKGYIGKDGYIRRQDYWHLVIGKKHQLLKLFDCIEPYLKHEKRINDLRLAKRNIIERNMRTDVSTME